jgi:hypothetical protein
MLVTNNSNFRICLVASYFTSALEVAVKERDVCVRDSHIHLKIYRFSVGNNGVYNFALLLLVSVLCFRIV